MQYMGHIAIGVSSPLFEGPPEREWLGDDSETRLVFRREVCPGVWVTLSVRGEPGELQRWRESGEAEEELEVMIQEVIAEEMKRRAEDIRELVWNVSDQVREHCVEGASVEENVVPALAALAKAIEEERCLDPDIPLVLLQDAIGQAARRMVAAEADAGQVAMAAFSAGVVSGSY